MVGLSRGVAHNRGISASMSAVAVLLVMLSGKVFGVGQIATTPVSFADTLDFSGKWFSSEPDSDTLVIEQLADRIRVTTIYCCRRELASSTSVFYFNRWGPRLARNPDDDKPTQVRWDGDRLILHQGPEFTESGGGGGFVQIWSLNGEELLIDTINRGLGLLFDFKESSIPDFFPRVHKTYARVGMNDVVSNPGLNLTP
jgi:hypothetical protein